MLRANLIGLRRIQRPVSNGMAYLIAILVALVLFFGFIALTAVERKRGSRIGEGVRAVLDVKTSRGVQALQTVDPLDFLVRGARSLFGHIIHDIANVLWAFVRMLERTLEGTVRRLRAMRHQPERTESNSAYVKSISSHKETLREESSAPEKTENTVG